METTGSTSSEASIVKQMVQDRMDAISDMRATYAELAAIRRKSFYPGEYDTLLKEVKMTAEYFKQEIKEILNGQY